MTAGRCNAGVDKLWDALGINSAGDEDVFTLAARKITMLKKALRRANRECEHMHHLKHEYHESISDCPVEKWVNEVLDLSPEQPNSDTSP